MNRAGQQGFTIIEVTLFLAISGLMVAGIIAFSMGNINQQRYRDTITTFQADLQQLYADTISVNNTRVGGSGEGVCNTEARGNSRCIVLGRYMAVNTAGDYTTYNVMATNNTCKIEQGGSDLDVLSRCIVRIDRDTSDSGSIGWGSSLGWPRTGSGGRGDGGSDRLGQARAFSMLVLRSPESGHVYTFTADAGSTSTAYINQMVRPGRTSDGHPGGGQFHGRGNRTICMEPAGFNIAEPMAILIRANASNAQHVELVSPGLLAETGVTTRC